MKVISMSMATNAFIDGTKSVTRRAGWKRARVGQRLRVVEQGQGLRKGERMKTLGYIELTNVRSERLSCLTDNTEYGTQELILEGFPNLTPEQFIGILCEHSHIGPNTVVKRLEFKRIEVDDSKAPQETAHVAQA
jgi:hypothetical protein